MGYAVMFVTMAVLGWLATRQAIRWGYEIGQEDVLVAFELATDTKEEREHLVRLVERASKRSREAVRLRKARYEAKVRERGTVAWARERLSTVAWVRERLNRDRKRRKGRT